MGVFSGILHPTFGIPAGVGDILAGVTAIPLAYILRKGYSWSKFGILIWGILGIVDLVMAIGLGIITSRENSMSTMNTFPWILIPTVGVPISFILHGATLYRLRNTKFQTN